MNATYSELQKLIAQGNEAAFVTLYKHFYPKLLRFAVVFLKNKEVAEEVTEDVFIKLWCNRTEVEKIENISVYLYVSVKNRCINALPLEKEYLDIDVIDENVTNNICDPYQQVVSNDLQEKISMAIEALPPRCKLIFKMVREDGLKYKEIAQILNISVNTIDAQMAIAVKKLSSVFNVQKPTGLKK